MQTLTPKLYEIENPSKAWTSLFALDHKGEFALTDTGALLISNGVVWVVIRHVKARLGASFNVLHDNAKIVTVSEIGYTL